MKNWISEENLKKAVEELHMDRLAKESIIMGCEKGHGNTYRKRKKLKVIIAFSALTIFLFCLPVRAQVKESLKQWLSHMTQKDISDMYDSVQNSRAEAYSVSRDLSWNEKIRKDQLTSQYKKGDLFPDGKIIILQQGEEANPASVCYDEISRTWYFPSHELTDEELLEIIDYEYKENYVLSIINESEGITTVPEQVKAKITEEQALETAKKLIEKAYDVNIDPQRIFIEDYMTGYYGIKYSGMELKDGYIEDCNIVVSSQDGKIDSVVYNDKNYTSSCSKTGEFPDWEALYDKGKDILFSITGESSIKKSYYLVFYGENSSKDVTKKIYYLYELENGDTYSLGFLSKSGILQSISFGDSYSENPEHYQSIWKASAAKKHINYKIVEIE
jgi:hypothetical protein